MIEHKTSMTATCSGHFRIEKLNANDEVIEVFDRNNLVTNHGLSKLATSGFASTRIALFADNTLITPEVITTTSRFNTTVSTGTPTTTRVNDVENNRMAVTYRFEQVLPGPTANINHNRIAIIDSNNRIIAVTSFLNDEGREISIQQNVGERMRIIYTFKLFAPYTEVVFNNVTIGDLGQNNVTIRPFNIDRAFQKFQDIGINRNTDASSISVRVGHDVTEFRELNSQIPSINTSQPMVPVTSVSNNIITVNHSTGTNVAYTKLRFGVLLNDNLHYPIKKKDGITMIWFFTTFYPLQIKFEKPLNYISENVDMIFDITFEIKRGE